MRVPSPSQTQAYFNDLGLALCRDQGRGRDQCEWQVRDKSGGARADSHASLVDLWAEWLHYAHHVLREESKLRLFMTAYMEANPYQRAGLMEALDSHLRFTPPDGLLVLFAPLREQSLDALPRNWKARFKKNLSSWIQGRPFRQTVFEELGRIDVTALDGWTHIDGLFWMREDHSLPH